MRKILYVVYDCISNDFGEVLSFNNEDEAKRAFIHTVFITPKAFRNDLKLYEIGVIESDAKSPFINDSGTKFICSSSDDVIVEAVDKTTREQFEQNTINAQIQAKVHEKLNSQFFNDLTLVSTYLATEPKLLKVAKKAVLNDKRR